MALPFSSGRFCGDSRATNKDNLSAAKNMIIPHYGTSRGKKKNFLYPHLENQPMAMRFPRQAHFIIPPEMIYNFIIVPWERLAAATNQA